MSGQFQAIESKAKRLAKRFERITEMVAGDEFNSEMKAACAQGGIVMRDCIAAGLFPISERNAHVMAECFSRDDGAFDSQLRETLQGIWLTISAFALSEHGNPLAMAMVSTDGESSIRRGGSSRTLAANHAEFFHDLAEYVAAGSADHDIAAEAEGDEESKTIDTHDAKRLLSTKSDATFQRWMRKANAESVATGIWRLCDVERAAKLRPK